MCGAASASACRPSQAAAARRGAGVTVDEMHDLEQPRSRAARESGALVLAGIVALMWVLEVVDSLANHRLDQYGIEPRETDGLTGIVAAPFLHAGFGHLASNTVPLVIMGLAIALGGAVRVLLVT